MWNNKRSVRERKRAFDDNAYMIDIDLEKVLADIQNDFPKFIYVSLEEDQESLKRIGSIID